MLLIGWSFIAAGLVARVRHPTNRFGLLMIAVGFAWFAAALTAANNAALFSIGLVITPLWIALFVHALLAFPNGFLETSLAKTAVALRADWQPLATRDSGRDRSSHEQSGPVRKQAARRT